MHLSRLFLFENFEIAKAETTSLPELDDARERKEKKMKDNELLVFTEGENGLATFLQVLKKQKKTDIWRRCYTK